MLRPLIPASLALLAAACTTATPGAESVAAAAPSPALPSGQFDFTGWDAYLGGADSSQFSALTQIDKDNVNQLEVAWTYPTGPGQPTHFNPLIAGGRMYVLTGDSKIAALDPATGREIWKSTNTGRLSGRGLNYWRSADGSDERLMMLNDGYVRAMDAKTGQFIDSFGADGKVDLRDALPAGSVLPPRPLMTDNPGRVFEDTFIVSLPAGAYDYASSPANVHAYDVRTGSLKWTFNMVPRVGEFGSESWPEKDRERFGGVHNWSEFTVDPELGIAYIPTGTARYDFYGGNRPGDNLYANSVVALDARTGKRVWHFQTIHHDLWDFDLPNAPKLMTITKDGRQIPVVIVAAKHGFVFVFDRRTGEPVWPIEERPVPASDVPGEKASPTQPFPTWPQPFARQSFTEADINPLLPAEDQEKLREKIRGSRNEGLFTPPSLQGSISMPGHNGGVNFGTSAVDPLNQRFFVVSREIPVVIKLNPDNRPEALAAMPNGDPSLNPYKSPVDFMLQPNGMVAIKPPFSFLTAYDMNTGEILYRIPDGESLATQAQGLTGIGSQAPRGGPVATASGLLFVGTAGDRTFRARDAATGAVLWEYKLDAATEGVPAIYEAGGRQYVTLPVGGDGLFAQKGNPTPGPSRYITFALPAR
ncbi:MAG TPA: PQQ-binding-like beta-propeller repeat protein [Croceibacterium sp.]|nr:PQQ-binding-like beta-propeller repeat protein [Croceibacterium sp.]